MAGITTTSILPPAVTQSFERQLLSVKVPNMIHKLAADKRSLRAKGGSVLRMRRYNRLGTAMVPLGNSGITPPPQNLTAVNIDAQMSFYGRSCAVVKSWVIDLELWLTDNKGQAQAA